MKIIYKASKHDRVNRYFTSAEVETKHKENGEYISYWYYEKSKLFLDEEKAKELGIYNNENMCTNMILKYKTSNSLKTYLRHIKKASKYLPKGTKITIYNKYTYDWNVKVII